MHDIRFKFSASKARAALHWMVVERSGIDLHTAVKACYFADHKHLNLHFRPVFGAIYRAMKFGPVPLEIYEMAKGEAIWLAELRADTLPWRLDGYRLQLTSNEAVDLTPFSESDFEALKTGFEQSIRMNFNERTKATHGKDWQAAELGVMRYEDMLDDSEVKPEVIRQLRETSRFMRL